jgi:hypothetical protein
VSASPPSSWSADTLGAALLAQGLQLEVTDELVLAANQLAGLQQLLAVTLPRTHLPTTEPQLLAPIADWLA